MSLTHAVVCPDAADGAASSGLEHSASRTAAATNEDALDLSVIVPVFNNASTLDPLIDRLMATLEPLEMSFELLFVDDGSSDESLRALRRHAAHNRRVRVFALRRNYGIQAAACAAFDRVRGRRVVAIDADLENPPEAIPRLLAELDRGSDLVCAYRENRGGPLLTRRLPSWLLNCYFRRVSGQPLRDVACGMRAMDARIVQHLESAGEERRFLTPLLLKRATRVAQVPVEHRPRGDRGGYSLTGLLGIAMDYYLLTAGRPFLISGLISVLLAVVGMLVAVAGHGLAGLLLLATGFLGTILSLAGELLQRTYEIVQRKPFYELRPERESADPIDGP